MFLGATGLGFPDAARHRHLRERSKGLKKSDPHGDSW